MIHGKATRKLVWLGDQNDDSDTAMAKFASLESATDFENLPEAENEAIGNFLTRPWVSQG
jgi:hypothetical protein